MENKSHRAIVKSNTSIGFSVCNVPEPVFSSCDQVLGNAKGAVAVVISIFIFRNPVTFVGMAGYTITVLGVVAYGEAKRRFR